MPKTTRAAAAALLIPMAALSAGCHYEGGPGYSADRFTYVSREWQPWTVSLVDTRTGESLWSVDVPVGQQLVVGFRQGAGPNLYKPDMMDWGLAPAGRTYGIRQNQMPVPPSHSRRLEPVLRPTPELPGTPLPGSPFTPIVDPSRTRAADAGLVRPGVADPWRAASPTAPSAEPRPMRVPGQWTQPPGLPPPPPEGEAVPGMEDSPTTAAPSSSDEPPIDLPPER